MKEICFVLLFFCKAHVVFGKIAPAHASLLTQTQIIFEIDEVEAATFYILEFYKKVTNKAPVLLKIVTITSLAILLDSIFEFGNQYYWNYKGYNKKGLLFSSTNFTFEIGSCNRVDPNKFKTIITSNITKQAQKGIIFLDYPAMAIDKNGKPVWYLLLEESVLSTLIIRDLQLSPYNSITYVDAQNCYEKELNGNLLWEAPKIDNKPGNFHHAFQKLPNNTYMACGFRENINEQPTKRYNTLIQWNAEKKRIWNWDEINAIKEDTIFKKSSNPLMAGHLNGFAFSKNANKLFLSFKNHSDVFLLDKVSGKMITSLKNKEDAMLFLQQHGPYFTENNELLLYNNNILDQENETIRNPSILIFSFDEKKNSFKKVWEYPVLSDSFPKGITGKEGFVMETKEKTILICTGGNNYALEVNRKKQKIWECYFYKRKNPADNWQPYSNYRCHSSSSLYPIYFTVQSKFSGRQIKINNDGSDDGVFEVLQAGNSGKILKTITIKSGQSAIITLSKNEKSLRVKPKGIEGMFREIIL